MFFQSDDNLEENFIFVPSSSGSKLTVIVFLAVFGAIPQSEPCLKLIWLGGSSEITLQPFSVKAALFWIGFFDF